MCYTLSIRLRAFAGLLCLVLLLLCVSIAAADPKPLSKAEQAKVEKAIDKGVAFLKRYQRQQGDWPTFWPKSWPIGQCALPAYALLEAGVPADDPKIQKAAAFLRPKVLKTAMTYEISLAILFFDRLGDPKDEKLIQRLALRLIAGQFLTGGWSYHNHLTVNEERAAELIKLLEALSRRMEAGEEKAKVIEKLDLPRPYKRLTVFHDLRNFHWREVQKGPGQKESMYLTGETDNSNTQFAILGLWAAQRHGVPMGPTFRLMVERFERSQSATGRWSYGLTTRTESGYKRMYPSMTCVGLLGLAIGRGAKFPTPGAPSAAREDLRVLGGLTTLYDDIGNPSGSMDNQLPMQCLYFLWSVERVAMLYNLPTIGDKDWYRWGAESLVTNQLRNGSWPGLAFYDPQIHAVKPDYGPVVNTAFALLFLKRSHPMRELTPKLPFTAKELNAGIAHLRQTLPFPETSTTTPSGSTNVESHGRKRDP